MFFKIYIAPKNFRALH